MDEVSGKQFEHPDEVREFTDGTGRVELVHLNGHTVGRGTFEPGWRWSQNVKPLAGTDSCQVDHIGYVLEGRMALKMDAVHARPQLSASRAVSAGTRGRTGPHDHPWFAYLSESHDEERFREHEHHIDFVQPSGRVRGGGSVDRTPAQSFVTAAA